MVISKTIPKIVEKYSEQSKEITQNWAKAKNFDLLLPNFCFYQTFISGRETGH